MSHSATFPNTAETDQVEVTETFQPPPPDRQIPTSPEHYDPNHFEIFTSAEYVEHLCNEAIPNARHEIHLQAMTWHFETDLEKKLLDVILAKAEAEKLRGNKDFNITLYFRFGDDLSAEDKEALARLYDAGVKVVPTERGLFFKDHTGQNHRKFGLIDDVAYWGGTNFHEEVISDTLDCMIATKNARIVEEIKYALLYETKPARNVRGFRTVQLVHPATHTVGSQDPDKLDHSVQDSTDLSNQVDAGVFDMIFEQGGPDRRSEIIDQAVKMIEMAEKRVILVSQFIPDGKVLRALIQAAKRGVEIEIITNDPEKINGFAYQTSAKANLQKIHMAKYIYEQQHRRNGNEGFKFNIRTLSDRVHMKALFVDENMCLVGSDNFVRAGESFQTAEFAVKTDHKGIVSGLKKLINRFARRSGDPIFLI